MKEKLRTLPRDLWEILSSKPARKLEAALISYVVFELTRRGYLPS